MENSIDDNPKVVVTPLVLVLLQLLKSATILARLFTQILSNELGVKSRHTEEEVSDEVESGEILRGHVVLF